MNKPIENRGRMIYPLLKGAVEKLRSGKNFNIMITLTVITMICGVMMGAARFSTQLTVRDGVGDSPSLSTANVNSVEKGDEKVFFTSYRELADGETEALTYTSLSRVLTDKGYTLAPEDKLEFTQSAEGHEVEVEIIRAFAVELTAAGVTRELMTTAATVGELLAEENLTYGSEDIIIPAATAPLTAGTAVTLQDISYRESTTESAIPFTTKSIPSPTLKKGEERVAIEGQEGTMTTRALTTYMDGKPVSTEVLSEVVTKEPTAQEVYTGVTTVKVNPNTAAHIELDANGNPISYSKIINGKSAAYSARAGAKTASGRAAVVGHVAVDPKVIPYGTKLYIKSSDSSDVYGYAIAADTGAALLDGRIIVDLFFGSYDESCDWGIHQVDIFVLD